MSTLLDGNVAVAADALRGLGADVTDQQVRAIVLALCDLKRLEHGFDDLTGLTFADFALRDADFARVCLRLVYDVMPLRLRERHVAFTPTAIHALDAWRENARHWGHQT